MFGGTAHNLVPPLAYRFAAPFPVAQKQFSPFHPPLQFILENLVLEIAVCVPFAPFCHTTPRFLALIKVYEGLRPFHRSSLRSATIPPATSLKVNFSKVYSFLSTIPRPPYLTNKNEHPARKSDTAPTPRRLCSASQDADHSRESDARHLASRAWLSSVCTPCTCTR